jgi:ABC-2 type transport system ATP-binding protein
VIGRGKVIADISLADLIADASSGRVTLRTTARP